jgi:Protein kinase domain
VHDSGEAGGFLYYVMPYVDGESLRTRLARHGELPIHDAVKILLEVTDALAYAHQRGVVHRDIKPDNVLLSGRHALVTDFGVAKAVSEATGRQQLTTAGVALGTPAYMAPEQAAAEPNIDHHLNSGHRLSCRRAELPQQEREDIGALLDALRLGQPHAVSRVEVDAEEHRESARAAFLQCRRHLGRLPRLYARVVDTRREEHGRVAHVALHVRHSIHLA